MKNKQNNIDWGEVIKIIIIIIVCVILTFSEIDYQKRIYNISEEVSTSYGISKEDALKIVIKVSYNDDIIELNREKAIHKDSGQIYIAEYREGRRLVSGITWIPTNEYDYEMLEVIEAIEASLNK